MTKTKQGRGPCWLAGFEYQMDVSVWLALDLLLAIKQAHELVLEPATEEDVEGELEDREPGRVVERLHVENYCLVVQARLRTGDAWTARRLTGTKDCLHRKGIWDFPLGPENAEDEAASFANPRFSVGPFFTKTRAFPGLSIVTRIMPPQRRLYGGGRSCS